MPPWFYLCLECSDGVGRYKYLAIAAFITIYTLHGFVSVVRSDRVISALGHSTTAFICAFLVNLFCLFSYWWFIYRFFVLIFIICFAIFCLFLNPICQWLWGSRGSCCCCISIDHSLFFGSGGIFACIRF